MTNLTMYGAFKEAANSNPRHIAIYYQGKKITFKKLLAEVDQVANILYHTLKVKENDVVLVSQPNIPEAIILFYALNKIGAIANLIHPFTPYNQVKTILEKTNSKYGFLFEQRIAKEVTKYREISDKIFVTRIEDHLPLFKKIIYHFLMNFRIRKKLGKAPPHLNFKGFKYLYQLKMSKQDVPEASFHKDRCTVLLHSGSTSGKPKTICLSDLNFNYIVSHAPEMFVKEKEKLKEDSILSILPSFHGFGLCMTMHLPLANGFTCIMVPKFDTKKVAKIFNQIHVSYMCGVPTIYQKLLNEPLFIHNRNVLKMRCAYVGGDYLPPSIENDFNELFSKQSSTCRLFQGYGLTEAVAANAVNNFHHYHQGSLGKAIPEAHFKIVDENGKEMKRGEIGEIILKSEAVMLGYYQDEESTKQCIKDGYLYTGDLGYMDEDDFIYFKQRKKRVVKVSGYPVFPSEVEQLIESMPEVTACAAIRIAHEKLQNAIKVFVVAKFFDEQDMKEKILDTCRKYLIRWSVPVEIEFKDHLPTTLLGKVDFKSLQEEEDQKHL